MDKEQPVILLNPTTVLFKDRLRLIGPGDYKDVQFQNIRRIEIYYRPTSIWPGIFFNFLYRIIFQKGTWHYCLRVLYGDINQPGTWNCDTLGEKPSANLSRIKDFIAYIAERDPNLERTPQTQLLLGKGQYMQLPYDPEMDLGRTSKTAARLLIAGIILCGILLLAGVFAVMKFGPQ